jgi:hypothetical protein
MHRLPDPAVRRLSEGDRTPEALYELFRDWQRTQIQSSVTALQGPRQQMDVWICRAQEPIPRGTRCALSILEVMIYTLSRACPASSRAVPTISPTLAAPQTPQSWPSTKLDPTNGFADDVMKGFASIVPPDADASAVADAIVKIVDTPFGKRPFRVHVDPTEDGAEITNMVMDRVRAELLRRIGLGDLLQVLT